MDLKDRNFPQDSHAERKERPQSEGKPVSRDFRVLTLVRLPYRMRLKPRQR